MKAVIVFCSVRCLEGQRRSNRATQSNNLTPITVSWTPIAEMSSLHVYSGIFSIFFLAAMPSTGCEKLPGPETDG